MGDSVMRDFLVINVMPENAMVVNTKVVHGANVMVYAMMFTS